MSVGVSHWASYHRVSPSVSAPGSLVPLQAGHCFSLTVDWPHSVRHTYNQNENLTMNLVTQTRKSFILPSAIQTLGWTAPPHPPSAAVSQFLPSPPPLLWSPPARVRPRLLEPLYRLQETWDQTDEESQEHSAKRT